VNRQTLAEPELAASWKVLAHGTRIQFQPRRDLKFPDGKPFTSADVVDSFTKLLAPELHSPIADAWRTEKGPVKVSAAGPYTVIAEFPGPAPQAKRLSIRCRSFPRARLRARRLDPVAPQSFVLEARSATFRFDPHQYRAESRSGVLDPSRLA